MNHLLVFPKYPGSKTSDNMETDYLVTILKDEIFSNYGSIPSSTI